MSKPARLEPRPIDDVLRGSLADIAAGQMQDFDAFLAGMSEKKVRRRVAEIEADATPSPALHAGL